MIEDDFNIKKKVEDVLMESGFTEQRAAKMGVYGKTEETVDFGGEVDYADYQWFKEPPPRQEVSTRPIF